MKKRKMTSALWLSVSAALILIDWLSKRWAETILAPQGTASLIEGVIGFRYAENTGAAFSVFSGATALLSAFSLAVCAAVAVYMIRHPESGVLMQMSLSMVLAGGVGNLIDRITRGYVIDFFELQFMEFAVFNVADICITAGAALLFIALLCGGEKNGRVDR